MKLNLSDYSDPRNRPDVYFSYEWSPYFQNESLENLVKRVTDCSKEFQPTFCAITWHNDKNCIKNYLSLKFAVDLHQQGLTVLLHLCSRGLTKENVYELLAEMKKHGIKNIFALKGDNRRNNGKSCFQYAKDLVLFIRENFGSYFTICVAGYPSGHPDSPNRSEELLHLKEKVDAGADFIITQIVFDADEFIKFVKNCRAVGIKVPIIPGILPLKSFDEVDQISKRCSITIPSFLRNKFAALRDKPTEFENYGVEVAVDVIKAIICSDIDSRGFHLFSMNRPDICLKVKKKVCSILSTSV